MSILNFESYKFIIHTLSLLDVSRKYNDDLDMSKWR